MNNWLVWLCIYEYMNVRGASIKTLTLRGDADIECESYVISLLFDSQSLLIVLTFFFILFLTHHLKGFSLEDKEKLSIHI